MLRHILDKMRQRNGSENVLPGNDGKISESPENEQLCGELSEVESIEPNLEQGPNPDESENLKIEDELLLLESIEKRVPRIVLPVPAELSERRRAINQLSSKVPSEWNRLSPEQKAYVRSIQKSISATVTAA